MITGKGGALLAPNKFPRFPIMLKKSCPCDAPIPGTTGTKTFH